MLLAVLGKPSLAEDIETKFLIPGDSIFSADFEDGKNPGEPNWQLRKSAWEVEDGVLRGINVDGNGPFIRLHSKESGGVLPEDYIMKFSLRIAERPNAERRKNKYHPTRSQGHRFSFGHYAAKYQWRPDIGMDLAIGHGHAIKDDPAYFMQHDHFRHKPSGWEFFTHIDEVGYLDNLQVWTLKPQTHKDWESTRSQIPIANQFLSSKHPTFSIEKLMNP